MARVGQNRKRDANEKAIVDALRAVGAFVFRVSAPGAPDLFVLYKGIWTPLEVKSAKGRYRPLQEVCPVEIQTVRSVDEALARIGVMV